MAVVCTWCGKEHETETAGLIIMNGTDGWIYPASDGLAKITDEGVSAFCSGDCRQNFHTSCQLWGEGAYGAGTVTLFQLQRCLGRHEHRAQHDLAVKRGKAPEPGKRMDGPLRGADTLAEIGP